VYTPTANHAHIKNVETFGRLYPYDLGEVRMDFPRAQVTHRSDTGNDRAHSQGRTALDQQDGIAPRPSSAGACLAPFAAMYSAEHGLADEHRLVMPVGFALSVLLPAPLVRCSSAGFRQFLEQVRGNPLPSGGGRIARTPEASF
jgi:hypothetical protein